MLLRGILVLGLSCLLHPCSVVRFTEDVWDGICKLNMTLIGVGVEEGGGAEGRRGELRSKEGLAVRSSLFYPHPFLDSSLP